MTDSLAPVQTIVVPPDALPAAAGDLVPDVAASGMVTGARDGAPWRNAPHGTAASVEQGRLAGCELTCGPPDAGLQALTANDGLLSITTRVAQYDDASAAAHAYRAIAAAIAAGHGPTGASGIACHDLHQRPADDECLRFACRYANPLAPDPHPVTLGFSIPPRTWREQWSVIRQGVFLGVAIIRFVGRPPASTLTEVLEQQLRDRMATVPAAPAAPPLWMLADETVVGRFHVAYEASSPAFRTATREALAAIDAALPGAPVRIRALRSPTMGEHNAGGLTKADGTVLLYARLEDLDLVPRLLKSSLAHELHHSVRLTRGPGQQDLTSLRGTIVLEGLGTVFQLEVCPAIPIRYAEALEPATEAGLWRRAQAELDQPLGPLAAEWFYGQGEAPRWTGYTIGTHIVQGYLAAHAGVTAADLVATDAAVILAASNYAP